MKASQVNKLYSKLSPQEQASLVFEAAARRDDSDVDAILAQVERKTYDCVHADYTRQIHALNWLVNLYGIEYWKNRTLMLTSCEKAEGGDQKAEETANLFFAKIVALEIALIDACKLFKIDVAAIKKMASCPVNETKGFNFPEVDAELIKYYSDSFSALMPK